MNDSTLWAVAIGIGLLGLLFLAIGTLAAVYWGAQTKKREETDPADQSPPRDKSTFSTDESQSQSTDTASSDEVQPPADGNLLTWTKAWIFALIHAGTVSLVLGGLTFFEDMVRANDEIQHTGKVTFPKKLLPEILTGSTMSKRLTQHSGSLLGKGKTGDEAEKDKQPDQPPTDKSEWKVLDEVDEKDSV